MLTSPNIAAICVALHERYGSPRHGNKDDPLDELVYIILSTRTRETAFSSGYDLVKATFSDWNDMSLDDEEMLAGLLTPFGLGVLKASQLVRIMEQLRVDFGSATLTPLAYMNDEDAETLLVDLPGVAAKIAKCVLMYSLDRKVLPVDVHTYRIAARIGYPVKRRADTSQDMIEKAIPPDLRYMFHVNAISLGRDVCLPKNPRCDECCINRWCDFYQRRVSKDTNPLTG